MIPDEVDSNVVLDMVVNIGLESSITKKKQMLISMENDLLKKCLLYAYNPFRTYHIKHIPNGLFGQGNRVFTDTTWKLLEALSNRRLSGSTAKNAVYQYIRESTAKSGVLFRRIIEKDMRMGVGIKIINYAYSGLIPTFSVMLAEEYSQKFISFPAYAEVKIDGDRGLYRNGQFYSRSGRLITGLDHLTETLKSVNAPDLDGELKVPGYTQAKSSGYIRSNRIKKPLVWFCIFDAPKHPGTYVERHVHICAYRKIDKQIAVVTTKHVDNSKELREFYDTCLAAGHEGCVVKTPNHFYQNRRSRDWIKMKEVKSVDIKVIDVYEGHGKYNDKLGGIVCYCKGVVVDVGGGFSDTERSHFWLYKNRIIGKTVEIEYQEETEDGSLRHPRFIRIRHDK